jgi:hypothetical protein
MSEDKKLAWIRKEPLSIAVIFGLLGSVVLVFFKLKASISYHPDISGSEGSTIGPIQLFSLGQPVYLDPEDAPFRLTQYTPLYFSIVSFFYKLTGWSALEVHKIYLASRAFSNVFTIAAVLISGLFVYRVTKVRSVAFFVFFYVFHVLSLWLLTTSRPDSLLILFTAVYLWVVYNAIHFEKEKHWWYIAVLVAVSAFFVKQSGATLSLALGLYWIVTRQWRKLIPLTFFGIAVFALYLLILPINDINLFFVNIIGGVANSTSWDWFYDWTLRDWLLQFAPLIAINLIISGYILSNRPKGFYLFLTVASFLFFVFATATAFKIGAGVGYYQDYLLTAVVQIALFLADAKNKHLFEGHLLKSALSVYLCLAFLHCTIFVSMKYGAINSLYFEGIYIEERKVAEYIQNEKNLGSDEWIYICSHDAFRGYFLSQFMVRNNLVPFPDIAYLAEKNGTFDYHEFRELIRKKSVKYVISKKGEKPRNIFEYDFGSSLKYSSTIGLYDIYEANLK